MKIDEATDLNLPRGDAPPLQLLLVDGEPRILSGLLTFLSDTGYGLATAANGLEAVRCLGTQHVDLVILDLQLADFSGHEIMDFMHARNLDCDVIVTSGATGIEAAIGALKRGAFDYLRKPYTREELRKAVDNAARQRLLKRDNLQIGLALEHSEHKYRNLVDSSPDLIYMLDAEGRVDFVNARARQLLGFEPAELVGRHFFTLLHEQDISRANYLLSEVRGRPRESRSVELRLKARTTHERHRTFTHDLMVTTDANGLQGTHGVARDVTDRNRADELILYQAYHDILTELPNRVLFKDRLGLALEQGLTYTSQLAVLCLDLDRFKAVNDTLGHAAGDALLRQVSERLKLCLRPGDTLARLGGDEFAVVLSGLGGKSEAERRAEQLTAAFTAPFALEGQAVHMSASIGVALAPQDGMADDVLLRHADMAMYRQKTHGKNGVTFFAPDMAVQPHSLGLERELHLAMERNELEMHYQPQVDARTGRVVAVEALMRWNHPQRGFLTAGEFVPFAETNGLIIPMTDWMVDAIGRDRQRWDTAQRGIRLSFNLPPQYLERSDFADKLSAAMERHRMDPALLEVEVTENICIQHPLAAIEQLHKLCVLGVRIAIDDFGTGYSSLSYLQRFPAHTLKIDRSFVMDIEDEQAQYPVVLAIVSIAKGLGLTLVAEGVETLAQARYLQKAGCGVMQGFRYHRPMPCSALAKLLA